MNNEDSLTNEKIDRRPDACRRTIARLKAEGRKLGRPEGAKGKNNKLQNAYDQIKQMGEQGKPMSFIAKVLHVSIPTLMVYIRENGLWQYTRTGQGYRENAILEANRGFFLTKGKDMSVEAISIKLGVSHHRVRMYREKLQSKYGLNGKD